LRFDTLVVLIQLDLETSFEPQLADILRAQDLLGEGRSGPAIVVGTGQDFGLGLGFRQGGKRHAEKNQVTHQAPVRVPHRPLPPTVTVEYR
jgi:hypothetical protein